MRIELHIDDEVFQVEVGDLHARPIVVSVDGEEFAVWPATDGGQNGATSPRSAQAQEAGHALAPLTVARPELNGAGGTKVVRAPMPGVILSVAVGAGDAVTAGQPLLVLEAMKMQNTIRATHDGRVGAVRVAAGQPVQHHDLLLEYE